MVMIGLSTRRHLWTAIESRPYSPRPLALAAGAFAQQAKQPEMTAEQKKEMDAMIAAGTPGAPHKAMAAKVGSYDAKVRNWPDPAAPRRSRPAP